MGKFTVTVFNGGADIAEKVTGVKGASCAQFTVVDKLASKSVELHTGEFFEGGENPNYNTSVK